MKKYIVTLTKEEREELLSITSKGKHESQKVINALILLDVDEGAHQQNRVKNEDIARVLNISMRKIDRVKRRFVEEGFEKSLGKRKPEREYKRKADGELEAHLIALSCSEPPEGFSRWTLRLLADKAVELNYIESISHESVRRILKNELKPWKQKAWVIPPQNSGSFVANMEKILDVYKRPYDPLRPVVCMDESPKQLIAETRKPIPASPGQPERYDYEYRRCGVSNIFIASEPLCGKRLVSVTSRRTKRDWAQFLEKIAKHYCHAELITLVMDNLSTHEAGALYKAFEPAKAKELLDRFKFVYTPKHGSWLNVAEIELSVLSRQCLNRRIDSIEKLREEVNAWQANRNNLRAKINWQFRTDDARIRLSRLYPTLEE